MTVLNNVTFDFWLPKGKKNELDAHPFLICLKADLVQSLVF